MPALTPLPEAPSTLDPENFSAEADAFVAALGLLVTELNLIIGTTIPAGSAAANTLTGTTLAANVLASSLTSFGAGAFATQSQMEAASSNVVAVTPGRLQSHPGVAKALAFWNIAGTLLYNYNCPSLVKNAAGAYSLGFGTAFSSVNYVPLSLGSESNPTVTMGWVSQVTTGIGITSQNTSATRIDSAGNYGAAFFGDQ